MLWYSVIVASTYQDMIKSYLKPPFWFPTGSLSSPQSYLNDLGLPYNVGALSASPSCHEQRTGPMQSYLWMTNLLLQMTDPECVASPVGLPAHCLLDPWLNGTSLFN